MCAVCITIVLTHRVSATSGIAPAATAARATCAPITGCTCYTCITIACITCADIAPIDFPVTCIICVNCVNRHTKAIISSARRADSNSKILQYYIVCGENYTHSMACSGTKIINSICGDIDSSGLSTALDPVDIITPVYSTCTCYVNVGCRRYIINPALHSDYVIGTRYIIDRSDQVKWCTRCPITYRAA